MCFAGGCVVRKRHNSGLKATIWNGYRHGYYFVIYSVHTTFRVWLSSTGSYCFELCWTVNILILKTVNVGFITNNAYNVLEESRSFLTVGLKHFSNFSASLTSIINRWCLQSSVCLICRVGVVSALPVPIVWSCRHSNCLLLAVEHLMLLLLEHGTVCRRMWHRHQHWPLFVKDWKRICFANLILTLFLNLIILSSGFEVARLYLGHLNKFWLIDWLIVDVRCLLQQQTHYATIEFADGVKQRHLADDAEQRVIRVNKTKPILGIAIEGGANTKVPIPRIAKVQVRMKNGKFSVQQEAWFIVARASF